MGILDLLGKATYQKIGETPLMMLFQDSDYFSKMHRGNFERYVRWRGLEMSEDIARSAHRIARVYPKTTYAEFVNYLSSPE